MPSPTEHGTRVTFAGRSDVGRVREHNEDAFVVTDLASRGTAEEGSFRITETGVLLAVSDGMGGAKAGDVASALSLEAVVDELHRDQGDGGASARLRRVVVRANRRVNEAARRPDRRGMGATLTAALLCDGTAHLAQIGDSRAYLIRDGRIRQVTHDQSYVQMLVDEGVMTKEEAEVSPHKNVILQAMGQPGHLRVALGRIDVREGDRLLLCSDGLTNELDDAQIDALAKQGVPAAACDALVRAALDAGGNDNVTVVLAVVE